MVKRKDRIPSRIPDANYGKRPKTQDFSSALAAVRALEKRKGVSRMDLARKYVEVCSLGLAQGRHREVIEYSLKWLRIEQDQKEKVNALLCLAEALKKIEELEQKERNMIASFAGGLDFTSMGLEAKKLWIYILQQLPSNKFLPQQLYLAESSFEEAKDRTARAHIANTYLLIAKRIKHNGDGKVDQAKVREKAEYLIRSAPDMIRDRSIYDIEIFHTLVINLIRNDLFDLVDETIGIFQPEAGDPIFSFIDLARIKEVSAGQAYAHMAIARPLEKIEMVPQHRTIIAEMQLLQIQITNDHLEESKKKFEEYRLEASGSFLDQVLLSERDAYPEIVKKIRAAREGIFGDLEEYVKQFNYISLETSFPAGSCLGARHALGQIYTILHANEKKLKLFITDRADGRFLAYTFPVIERNQVSPRFSLEGMRPEDQNRMPLLWEYLALLACAGLCREPEKMSYFKSKINEIKDLIYRAAIEMMECKNREGWEAAGRILREDIRYNLNQIEISNRLFTAKKTVEIGGLIRKINSAELAIEKGDLLYGLVETIKMLRIYDFNILAEETGQQRKEDCVAYAVVNLRGGKQIYVEIGADERIEIPGIDLASDSLLSDYMVYLACEAVIKVSIRSSDNAKGAGVNGYLINVENDAESEKTKNNFEVLCRNSYLSILWEKGLLWPEWFVREGKGQEDFYRPLSDQSRKAKKTVISLGKTENIYLQADPLGVIQRLPVRKIREGKEISIAPWKRNPLREEQQRLFSDTRQLPEYYGLYIVTSFSDGNFHLRRYALARTEEEMFSDDILGRGEKDLREGKFRNDLRELFRGTKKSLRERLQKKIIEGEISIVEQKIEIFHPIQTTYRHPHMVSLASLLAREFKLE